MWHQFLDSTTRNSAVSPCVAFIYTNSVLPTYEDTKNIFRTKDICWKLRNKFKNEYNIHSKYAISLAHDWKILSRDAGLHFTTCRLWPEVSAKLLSLLGFLQEGALKEWTSPSLQCYGSHLIIHWSSLFGVYWPQFITDS